MPTGVAHRLVPWVLLAAGGGLVASAPAEHTLGAGIRWVSPHVGLVWAGTLALVLAAATDTATAALAFRSATVRVRAK